MALTSGDKLGPYEVVALLGEGGMGEVWKARDTRLDRTVAIKVLPEHIAKREDLRARFEREDLIGSSFEGQMITLRTAGIVTRPGFQSQPDKPLFQIPRTGNVASAGGKRFLAALPVKQSAPISFDVVLNWQLLLQK